MDFKDKEVAEKYQPVFDADREIHLPCGCKKMLSEIKLKDADGMYQRKSNLIRLKPVQTAPKKSEPAFKVPGDILDKKK